MADFIKKDIEEVTARINKEMKLIEETVGKKIDFDTYASLAIDAVIEKAKKTKVISLEDQHLIGAILGSMLHEAYCDSRRLEQPNENGLLNNPREKKLTEPIDAEFVQDVLEGKIPQSSTLYIRDGKVFMDIANTEFVNLSPYWKKDNYMAGKTAARSVITCWDGLSHENPDVQKYVTIAVANGIHESWISRGNIYYDEYQGQIFTNADLDTAYIYLPDDEKDKDLEHLTMASKVIKKLVDGLSKNNNEKQGNKSQDTPPSGKAGLGE